MASREVTVRVSAQDNFSSVMDRYNRQMGTAEQATRRANDANQQATQGFGRLGTAIGGAIALIGVHQIINFAEDFSELGTQVNIASRTFEQLSDSIDPNNQLLGRLQEATGGIVDNMTLMSGASRLLSMGLATNSSEVERLTELAVRLGSSMGNDAQASIENFSLLLANESVLRLDSFGISSSRVRQRIDELLASGEAINRSEAFRLAVLEEGGRSLERLGDAAGAAETELAQLQTSLNNFFQSAAEGFAEFVNNVAGVVNDMPETVMQVFLGAVDTFAADDRAAVRFADQLRNSAEIEAAVLDVFSLAVEGPAQSPGRGAMAGFSQDLMTIVDLQAQFAPLAEAGAAAWEQTQAAIEQAATAFSNISLGTLLGEGQGNLALGGIGDMVIAELNARGTIDADALQQAADAYNLAAGRITESSITMRDIVAPILADITMAQGGAVGAQRAEQVEGFFRNMAATGQQDNVFTPLFAELATGTFAGIDFQGLILEPFNEAFEDLQGRLGGDSDLAQQAADSMSRMPDGVNATIEQTDVLQAMLDTMTKKKYTIELQAIVDQTQIDAMIGKINGIGNTNFAGIEQTVRDNGGQVPGADPRGNVITEF